MGILEALMQHQIVTELIILPGFQFILNKIPQQSKCVFLTFMSMAPPAHDLGLVLPLGVVSGSSTLWLKRLLFEFNLMAVLYSVVQA